MSNLFHPILLPSWSSPAVLPTSALLLLVVLYPLVFGTRRKDSDVYELGGLSILTTWSFFNRRSDFLTSSFAKTGQKLLSFKVLHVRCCIVHLPYQDKDPTFFFLSTALCGCDGGRGGTQDFLRNKKPRFRRRVQNSLRRGKLCVPSNAYILNLHPTRLPDCQILTGIHSQLRMNLGSINIWPRYYTGNGSLKVKSILIRAPISCI